MDFERQELEDGLKPQKLQILYEDQDLLVVNKPAGMVTHPSGSHYQDSISNLLAAYFREKNETTRIRSIGRLDKETSGILLFARNQVAAARLQKQREEGKLQKKYLALAEGDLSEANDSVFWKEIAIPLAPDPENPMKMTISPDGLLPGSRNAVTYYKNIKSFGNVTLVELQLETGRTHQIRVHMSGIGHPLLGDTMYNPRVCLKMSNSKEKKNTEGRINNRNDCFKRAALHAWKLTFCHPFTDEIITLEAPLPDDFCRFLNANEEEKNMTETQQTINNVIAKMIAYSDGNKHDIAHFLKVYTYARMIGEMENLTERKQEILEIAAVIHDIACPVCRVKYGNTNGSNQEKESPELVENFLKDVEIDDEMKERINYLVSHHHTYTNVDGLDYRILLEADFLVNADESEMSENAVETARERVFETNTGKNLLTSIYKLPAR